MDDLAMTYGSFMNALEMWKSSEINTLFLELTIIAIPKSGNSYM